MSPRSRARWRDYAALLLVVGLAAGASSAWRAWVARGDAEQLRALVRPGDIQMISSETCGWCTTARRWMQAEGLPFSECFIERDAACLDRYRALGAAGTPTLVVRGQRVLGFDRGQVIEILK